MIFDQKKKIFFLDVEKLLQSPILRLENFDIKLKRTKQLIDRTSFKLNTSMNSIQEKLTEGRVRLYVAFLVRDNASFTINDLSTRDEQIFFIQYNHEIGRRLSFVCFVKNLI